MSEKGRPMSDAMTLLTRLASGVRALDAQFVIQEDGGDFCAINQILQIVVGARELIELALQLRVDRHEFFVERLQLLFRRFQFFVRALQLLVGRLKLFVGSI